VRLRPKTLALVLLALLSFAFPALERAMTGRVEMFSTYGIVDTVLSLIAIFVWYHLDKDEHHYRAGTLMNAGVLVAAIVALPIYLVRSRGWRRGAIAIAWAAAFLAVIFALEELGEWLGAALTS
jgi:peptidoglycan/LPS O-acetylase OafA/YrhL